MDSSWSVRRPARDLRPGDHAWLAFADDDERAHVMGAFVEAGLGAGEEVILLADRDAPPPPGGPGGPGRAPTVLVREDLCPPAAGPLPVLEALAAQVARAQRAGHRRIRIGADWTWALAGPDGLRLLLECERRIEAEVAPSTSLIAICQVDRRVCDEGTLGKLAAEHEVVAVPDPEFADSVLRIDPMFAPAGLSLSGELDASRHAVFGEALSAALSRAGRRPVHLDLAGLDFIDLTALSMLAEAATLRRAGCGPLVLDRISCQLRAVLEAIGWDMLPGLRLNTLG